MRYSQNEEELHILSYFYAHTGRLLDVGANDGRTFSNSLALIQRGWAGVLVEPSPSAFTKLELLHASAHDVYAVNVALGPESGHLDFYDSGTHLQQGDTGLLSTLVKKEIQRWRRSTHFDTIKVPVVTVAELLEAYPGPYDLITIDAEGMDWEILRRLDLTDTRCVCVEHNGRNIEQYIHYCAQYGLTQELCRNAENILLAR